MIQRMMFGMTDLRRLHGDRIATEMSLREPANKREEREWDEWVRRTIAPYQEAHRLGLEGIKAIRYAESRN